MRRGFVLVLVLLVAAAGLGFALRSDVQGGPTAVLLYGIPVDSGYQEVPPHPVLTLELAGGSRSSDYRASLDGTAVAVESRAGVARVPLPAMPQASWHHFAVWRVGLLGGRSNASDISFRTAEPLRLAAAWLVGPTSTRVDVSWSRPLRDPAPLEVAMRSAGAAVERTEAAIVGRWPAGGTGAKLAFTVPAGFRSSTGSYLTAPFAPAVTLPAGRPYSEVQLSEQTSAGTAGLKLQAYYVSTPTGRADLAAHANQIDVLTPDFYGLGGDGHLYAQVDGGALAIASAAGIEVQPLVTNLDFDAGKAHAIIGSPTGAATAAASLVAEARTRGYKGYQLDFENIHVSDRDGFSRFSATLGRALAAAGLKYTTAVIPRKLSSSTGILSLAPQASVYDFPALSRESRWLTLMAYDQHTSGTGPGPVAAIDWVRQVLAGGSAGVDHSRLFLGVPLYYRDWTIDGETTVGPYSEALQNAIDSGAGIGWDFPAASAFVGYKRAGAEHILWMDNRASLAAKIAVAKEMGFGGVSIWRLGFEDPGFWDLWPSR
jgi:spore germination protein YaaH